MSISAISSAGTLYSTAVQEAATKRQEDAEALAAALKAGDLAASQKAFDDLQSLQRANQGSGNPASGQSTVQNSNIQSLASALQAGDLSGAQAAFAAVQKGHRGHHHHQAKAGDSSASPDTSNPLGDAASQLLGTMVNVKA
jgi:hypothetical protein